MKTHAPEASTDLAPVWRALADPSRRRMLDLLRIRPMTTGELAAEFLMSRYGVMKHLGALVDAGLVLVRRRGRERWNHLNAVPIQQIYRRWIHPFEGDLAGGLLRIKELAEAPAGVDAMPQMTETSFNTLDIHLEVSIKASPSRVWEAITRHTSEWWPKQFYVSAEPRAFSIEDRVGGRVFEDWGNGEGMLWSTITAYKRNEMLQWVGDLAPSFGGPARSITTFQLEAQSDATKLEFRDTSFGQLSEQALCHLEEGWTFLVEQCLKPYIEHGKHPERPDSVSTS